MIIKLSIIYMFASLIFIDAKDMRNLTEKPFEGINTRGGKLFGFLSAPKNPIFPIFLTKTKHWRGGFLFSLGGWPIISTSVEYSHAHVKSPLCFFCLQHPQQINALVNQDINYPQDFHESEYISEVNNLNSQISTITQHDPVNNSSELPFNSTSISVSASITSMLKDNETSRTLESKDYDVIKFDLHHDDDDDDDINQNIGEKKSINNDDSEEKENKMLNRKRREILDLRKESSKEIESITLESSIQHTTMTTAVKEDLQDNYDTTISSTLELPQKPSQDFLLPTVSDVFLTGYMPSKNPNVQQISIAHKPQRLYNFHEQNQSPLNKFYYFYPSQPDYSQYYRYDSFQPSCFANYKNNRYIPSKYFNTWRI